MSIQPRIAVYYEHPEWFKPLFAEFARRGIEPARQLSHTHRYDPAVRTPAYDLVVNRMSPSAYLRGHGNAVFYTLQYLSYLKSIGANVVNGFDAFHMETSKAHQLDLFESLGLPYPKARVINSADQALAAADGLTFPIVVKPNIGGSGAKIRRFDSPAELAAAVAAGEIDLGIDQTGLVQEYLSAKDGHIVRVETLNGKYLYAIKVFPKPDEGFNLCPADICQPGSENALNANLAPGVPAKLGLRVEAAHPPRAIIESVERIMQAAQIDVGGVEYMINERDGRAHFYDVNALSNFVADAPNVIGFDPFPRLVDFLLERAGERAGVAA